MSDQVEWIRKLGQGGYGKVWQIRDTIDENEYALKVIKIRRGKYEETLREAQALSQIEHQNVVRYYHSWMTDCSGGPRLEGGDGEDMSESSASSSSSSGVSFTDSNGKTSEYGLRPTATLALGEGETTSGGDEGDNSKSGDDASSSFLFLWIKLELCDLSLRTWIDDMNRSRMPLSTILNVFFQLTVVVKFIHGRKNLIHRDLKPENILLKKRKNLPPQVKVGDFGLVSLPKGGNRNANGTAQLTASLGTYPYAAPEMSRPANASHMLLLDAVEYDAKVDVYAMGIILMELLFPITTRQELYTVCREIVDTKKFPSSVGNGHPGDHKEEKDKIVNMMEPDPEFRPEAKKIHIWMKSYNKSAPKCTCHPCT